MQIRNKHTNAKGSEGQALQRNSGQVMLISVIMLGGILLSAAAIAGLLTIYQIRAANDVVNSAKAIFAADTGIEVVSWCFFKGCSPNEAQNPPAIPFDDASVSFEVNSSIDPVNFELNIVSRGLAANGKAIRILEAIFETPAP
ncbi:MAG: hypothetical protein KJI72_02735 [Patescibacteria group bacterium]|nr:hypothetical protein [Patescibacteria group bacterium]